MSAIFRTLSAPLLMLLASAGVAAAQVGPFDRGHNEGVRERPRPEFEPAGMPVGAFRLYPKLGVGVESDSNVFAVETGETEDTIFSLTPSAVLRSQWSRHELVGEVSADHDAYQDLEDESTTDWRAGLNGRLDILRSFVARGGVGYADGHEMRGPNDPTLDPLQEPVQVEETYANASISKEFGRFRLTGGLRQSTLDYEDGTRASGANFDQDFRDRDLLEWNARADLALSPDTAVFVSYADRAHDYDVGNRDFETKQALIGAGLDLTNLVRGEIGVGYVWTEFDDPTQEEANGLSLNARIDWFVTQLTNVGVWASRDVTDAGIVGATSISREEIGVRFDHELRRNVLLLAEAAQVTDEYEGGTFDREDERTTFSLGADWLVNRWATLGARIGQEEITSEGVNRDRDYDRTRASIGLTLRR